MNAIKVNNNSLKKVTDTKKIENNTTQKSIKKSNPTSK
jgi:hypothetical protein